MSMEATALTRFVLQQQPYAGLHARHGGQDAAPSRAVVAELVALFLFQVVQAMRRTVPETGLLGQGFAHELYTAWFDQEVARVLAHRDELGLTALLQRQLEPSRAFRPAVPRPAAALAAYRRQLATPPPPLVWPVAGTLSSPFGWRHHPLLGTPHHHTGIDLAAPAGTLVRAAAPGRVVFSGVEAGYGHLVILAHEDGYQTYYAHNAENLVAVGEEVARGQPIARVGSTGRSSGPHLHFELRQHGQPRDPLPWLAAKRSQVGAASGR
ncbi:MAG: hypothetical protein KatS3mg131_1291 [Candidatus Tectimicrobiota bacterium]|nr:MAG: hypothetical protein KatS3mg131_1291 [Candidatus Tectomicrobia bacterium]